MSADAGPARITGVSGGPLLAAEYAELEQLAGHCARAGLGLLAWMRLPASTLVDPELLASAALAPVSFGRVEAALGATALGTDALPFAAARWEAMATKVIAARVLIEEVDRGEVQRLWVDVQEVLLREAPDAGPLDQVTLAAGGAAGLLTSALGARTVGITAGWLGAHLYGPEGSTTTRAVPLAVPGPRHGPYDIADLARHLSALSALSDADHPENDGTIEVQTLVDGDGTIRHVVYLPGTDDLNPFSNDGQVRDMKENIRLLGGEPTAYGAGIVTAMQQAGVRPGEPVLLVGHSQGGMEAVALASHGTPFSVTDVVTFGAPTAQIAHYPAGVQVLSLEHVGDVVPELDGAPSSTDPAQVTVRFDDGVEGLIGNHSFEHYTAGAQAVDASPDPTIRASLAGLHDFLAPGQRATAQVFQITRDVK